MSKSVEDFVNEIAEECMDLDENSDGDMYPIFEYSYCVPLIQRRDAEVRDAALVECYNAMMERGLKTPLEVIEGLRRP